VHPAALGAPARRDRPARADPHARDRLSPPVPRTVVLTLDNLGSVAEEGRGTWPGGPDDDHPSLRALPRVLALLGELDLPATFFVEGVNAERHPAAVEAIAAGGHEVGLHAWRHERWADVPAAEQARLAERGVRALAALGVAVEGFRPPGGGLGEGGLAVLADAGLTWCSPEGEQAGRDAATGMGVLPFRWPLVDAVYRYAPLAERVLEPAEATARLRAELDGAGEPAVLVLHPFLFDAETERLLTGLAADPGLRFARGRDATV
jgi:peptidoglycan/xylan/chitin deacetylase (PgdA/CDA1 family)